MNRNNLKPIVRSVFVLIENELKRRNVDAMPALFDGDTDHALLITDKFILKLNYFIHGMWDFEDCLVEVMKHESSEVIQKFIIEWDRQDAGVQKMLDELEF